MAAALIDLGVIMRLIAGAFDAIASGSPAIPVRHLGEPDPPAGADVWIRLLEVNLQSVQRHRGDKEPDIRDIEVVFAAFTSEAQQSKFAIATAASVLMLTFEGATLVDPALPAAAVHQVDLTGSRVEITNIAEAERRIRAGIVTFTGQAQRWTGSSIVSFLNP